MEVICWLYGHTWKLILGSQKVGWAITCDKCGKSIYGEYEKDVTVSFLSKDQSQ